MAGRYKEMDQVNDSGSPNDPRIPSNRNSNANSSFESDAPQRRSAPAKRPRRFGYYFKWTAIWVLCLAMVTAGTVVGYFYRNSRFLRNIWTTDTFKTALVNLDPRAPFDPVRQFPGQHTMNVLLLGCDSDYVEHVDHPIVVKNAPGRSDSIMVAHVDFDKKTINILSIPRDTAAPIPGL